VPICEGVFQTHAWDPTYAWVRPCVPFCDGASDLGQTQAWGELARLTIWSHHESGKTFPMWDGVKSSCSRRKTNSLTRRHAMNGSEGKTPQKGKSLINFKARVSNPKEILQEGGSF
jgi:hypothetical protein